MDVYQELRRPVFLPIWNAVQGLGSSAAELNRATLLSPGYAASVLFMERDCGTNVAAAMAINCGLTLTLVPKKSMNDFAPAAPQRHGPLGSVAHDDDEAVFAMSDIVEQLVELRRRSEIPINRTSAVLGVSQQTLRRLDDRTGCFPKLSTVQRYADVLGLAVVTVHPSSPASGFKLVPNKVHLAKSALSPPFFRAGGKLPALNANGRLEALRKVEEARLSPSKRRRFAPERKPVKEDITPDRRVNVALHDRLPERREAHSHSPAPRRARHPRREIQPSQPVQPSSWAVRQCVDSIKAIYGQLAEVLAHGRGKDAPILKSLERLKDVSSSAFLKAVFSAKKRITANGITPEGEEITARIANLKEMSGFLQAISGDASDRIGAAKATGMTRLAIDRIVDSPGAGNISSLLRLADALRARLSIGP